MHYLNHDKNGKSDVFWSAVVGAAVGATAVLMADKKNRDMLKKRVSSFLESADEMKEQGKARLSEEIKKTKGRIRKAVEE